VRSGGERQVAVRLAGDVETVGVGELLRVAIGGADAQVQVRTRFEWRAADRDRRDDQTVTELIGALEP
jgi:hypothetical protein